MSLFIPCHLRLKERKALAARTIFYEMTERHWPDYATDDDEGLRANFLRVADEELKRESDCRLDEWLVSIVKDVEAGVKAFKHGQLSPKVTKAIGDLHSSVSSISCIRCGKDKVCNSGHADDHIVSNGGDCIATFKSLYNFAREVTLAYYERYSLLFRGTIKPEAVFSTRFHLDGRPHDIPSPVFVGGVTSYVERGQSAYSEVALVFHIPGFDWKSMLTTLYVLLHEFACHAYSAIYPNGPLGRRDPVEYDTFSEGWMDRVVSVVVDDLAQRQGPASTFDMPAELPRFLAEAREFQKIRKDCRRSDRSKTASLIASGYRAAKAVEAVFKRFSDRDDVARDLFLEMSFGYNVLNNAVRERNAMVNKLAERLRELDSRPYRKCAQVLVQYTIDRDLPGLLAKLAAL